MSLRSLSAFILSFEKGFFHNFCFVLDFCFVETESSSVVQASYTTHCVAQAGLELLGVLSRPLECWDYELELSHPFLSCVWSLQSGLTPATPQFFMLLIPFVFLMCSVIIVNYYPLVNGVTEVNFLSLNWIFHSRQWIPTLITDKGHCHSSVLEDLGWGLVGTFPMWLCGFLGICYLGCYPLLTWADWQCVIIVCHPLATFLQCHLGCSFWALGADRRLSESTQRLSGWLSR